MSEELLRVENLSVYHKEKELLKSISFNIYRGEIVGLVGESGSGKSLTSLAILGLLPHGLHATGQILFRKDSDLISLLPLSSAGAKVRGRDITMIFQDSLTSLNPVLKVGKQAIEEVRLHYNFPKHTSRELLLEWFKKLHLVPAERIYRAYPHELSGGQRQRVMMASALSVRPSLLIADEPTTALDPIVQKEIIDLLKYIHEQENLAILFISHDLLLVKHFCQRVFVLQQGQLVESGEMQKVFYSPRHGYTKMLIQSLPETVISQNEKKLVEQPLLSVRNLSVAYNKGKQKVFVLQNLSFDVNKGEILGIVGRSGEGKSTLARVLMLLQKPEEGQILFNGRDLTALTSKELRRIRPQLQIIFQDALSSFHPSRTFEDQLLEPMNIHRIFNNKKERLEYLYFLFEKTELPLSLLKSYPFQASGGQRQRLQIVRALALKPLLLILDEAISAIDVHLKKQILDLLLKLQSEFDLTYLFISHEMSYVRYFCSKVMILKAGKILEQGKTEELFSRPQSDETKLFIEASIL